MVRFHLFGLVFSNSEASLEHLRNDLPRGLPAFYFSASGLHVNDVPKMVRRRKEMGGRGQGDLSKDVWSVSSLASCADSSHTLYISGNSSGLHKGISFC